MPTPAALPSDWLASKVQPVIAAALPLRYRAPPMPALLLAKTQLEIVGELFSMSIAPPTVSPAAS